MVTLPAILPETQALSLVHDKRHIIFFDDRGVVYCEKADHTKVVMSCLGKTMGGQPTQYRDVIHWQGKDDIFTDQVRALSERGFTVDPDMAYLTPNHWGVVKVFKVVKDQRLGNKLTKIMRKASPEGMLADQIGIPIEQVSKLKDSRPLEPFTSHVIRQMEGVSSLKRRDYVKMHNGPAPTPLEQDWMDRWVAFG